MFDIKGTAELKNINLRVEMNGDDFARAMDLLLVVDGVPADKLTSAIPNLRENFYEGDQPQLQEIYPLIVRHKIENIAATLKVDKDSVKLKAADVSKIEITPQPGGICQVRLTVQSSMYPLDCLATLSLWLRHEIALTINERQLRAVGME